MRVLLSEMCVHLAGGTALDFVDMRRSWGWNAPFFDQQLDALLAIGLPKRRAERLHELADTRRARDELRRCQELGVRLVSWRHDNYPAPLRHLPQPPLVLGVLGRWPVPAQALAVVGSRAATAYGRQSTLRLAAAATRAGFAIVSGLARGIDRAALEAALDGDGWPVAVLGCGLDVVYPPEHAELQRTIVARGTLVSEFPLGQQPDRYAFPRRNRVLAALARAVLVVEAGERSGALITADHALDLGLDVLAVPGPIDSDASQGTNRLIFDGAQPVLDEAGLLQLLGARGAASAGVAAAPPAVDDPQRLLAALGRRALSLDELVEGARLDAGRARAGLIALELEGRVRRVDGGRYALCRPA
jgi:DNA processing protein